MKLLIAALSLALSVVTNAQEAKSIRYNTASGAQIIITDLGLLPGGSFSSGLAINNQPIIVGLANDSTFALQRPFWEAITGVIIGFADNFNPASTAIPEHVNDRREMAGTEVYGDNVYQAIYWNSTGQSFVLPPLAGVDPFYGGLHTKAHGINNLGQLVGTGKEGSPNFSTHAALWLNRDTQALDLGFLGQGIPLNYSEAYGINDLSHVVGNSAVGSLIRGFLWRNGQMVNLGALSGQVVSEAYAVSNTGLIAGKSNFFPVIWQYDIGNPNSTSTISQLPIPSGFFSATPTAVNDSEDVVGYAGSPNIDSHAILWRDGVAIDLGVWPGGHYSVANGINNFGQIVGSGTIAGDNLDHALMWTLDTFIAAPTSAVLFRGELVRGSVQDLVIADGTALVVRVGLTGDRQPPVQIDIGGHLPLPNPTRLCFQIVASTSLVGLQQEVWMRNAQSGTFELVDTRPATTEYQTARIDLGPNVMRFIDPAGNVTARVKWFASSPTISRSWQVSVDQAVWPAGL